MKIVVVDDSKASRMLVTALIRDYDSSIEILEGANGEDAINLCRTKEPDIFFLDLTMPVMDGFEALDQIKKLRPASVVLILTADVQKKSIEKCLNSGAYAVLKKLPTRDVIYGILDKTIKGET